MLLNCKVHFYVGTPNVEENLEYLTIIDVLKNGSYEEVYSLISRRIFDFLLLNSQLTFLYIDGFIGNKGVYISWLDFYENLRSVCS